MARPELPPIHIPAATRLIALQGPSVVLQDDFLKETGLAEFAGAIADHKELALSRKAQRRLDLANHFIQRVITMPAITVWGAGYADLPTTSSEGLQQVEGSPQRLFGSAKFIGYAIRDFVLVEHAETEFSRVAFDAPTVEGSQVAATFYNIDHVDPLNFSVPVLYPGDPLHTDYGL